MTVRAITFYLPQFHPIPENDNWWGKGFTEWTNVTKATPLFKGHCQPLLPGELGFYDLRLAESREAQACLASSHGIEGFCYWHYWFHGRRVLERPFDEVLSSGKPNFPFCLAWANESWSRSWLGTKTDIILDQRYSHEDDFEHARWLAKVFADPRNIRVHGRPLFLIYKPKDLPDPKRTTDIIRDVSVKQGLPEPYLVGINAHSPDVDMRSLGFDMTECHEPQFGPLARVWGNNLSWKEKIAKRLGKSWTVYTYEEARSRMEACKPSYPYFPALFVGWDNTARRGANSWVITGSTPERVGQALDRMIQTVSHKHPEERIIFVNAWNEWAEGMVLEPTRHDGDRLLKEFKKRLVIDQGTCV